MMAPPQAVSGMVDAQARIAAIQSRLDTLSPGAGGGFAPALATAAAEGTATGAADRGASTAAPTTSAPTTSATTTSATPAPAATGSGTAAASGAWAERLPDAGRPWAGAIEQAATEAGIDPALLAALVQHESGFRPDVVSHAGAIGLAQLMPGTAEGLGVDPRDPLDNLRGGARYLKDQLDRFGSPELALAAYNAGPTRVAQAGGIPRIAETQAYVPRVISTWEQLR